MGGLGITPLRIKNLALLAKWWGKLSSNKTPLWKSIVISSFGPSFRGKIMSDVSTLKTSQLSSIWRDLINLQKDDSLQGIVGSNVWNWKVGNGASILFWYDPRANGLTLKDEFPCLFRICFKKNATVKEC
ncbi:uncharacterized protein [Rutidosis leptorrhynchoides]|uniref:uncharacterized protein n=1 Tax=Rutidosis leptorrhynchoides TaxID=125765 RepID=UPI003A99323A